MAGMTGTISRTIKLVLYNTVYETAKAIGHTFIVVKKALLSYGFTRSVASAKPPIRLYKCICEVLPPGVKLIILLLSDLYVIYYIFSHMHMSISMSATGALPFPHNHLPAYGVTNCRFPPAQPH